MRQPATMRDAQSKVKGRWLDRRVEKLSEENDKLRDAVEDLRHELDAEHGRSKETLSALSKTRRRPGRMKWLVLAGGAYVLGAKAGRTRYEQMKGWVRSMTQQGSMSETNGVTLPTTSSTTSSRSGV